MADEHTCTKKEAFDKLWYEIDIIISDYKKMNEKIHAIEKKQAVQESDMVTVKGDISEMKKDIKELSDDVNKGNSKLFISIIVSGLTILAGLIFTIILK